MAAIVDKALVQLIANPQNRIGLIPAQGTRRYTFERVTYSRVFLYKRASMIATDSHKHIGIAGAGLLGRLLAWQLLKRGYRVSLFDAGAIEHSQATPSPAAGFTAAGMVAPLSEAVVSERAIYDIGLRSLELWPEFLESFEQKPISESDYYFQRGSLAIAHAQDGAELQQFDADLQHILGSQQNYQRLNGAQIQALEPGLAESFQQGLFLQSEAHLHNRQLLNHLLKEIIALGAKLYPHTPVDPSACRMQSKSQHYKFDLCIDSRGFGAKHNNSFNSTVRGVRGEVLSVQTKEVQLQRPVRLMHPRYQLYIVPKPDNIFVIGATSIESEDLSPMSLQSNLELSSALYTLNPAFAEARIIDMSVNLRPAFMDNMPRVSIDDGIIRVNGLYRHGYLLAPTVVDDILCGIEQRNSPFQSILRAPEHAQIFNSLNTEANNA